jgi:hypothetical protein
VVLALLGPARRQAWYALFELHLPSVHFQHKKYSSYEHMIGVFFCNGIDVSLEERVNDMVVPSLLVWVPKVFHLSCEVTGLYD